MKKFDILTIAGVVSVWGLFSGGFNGGELSAFINLFGLMITLWSFGAMLINFEWGRSAR